MLTAFNQHRKVELLREVCSQHRSKMILSRAILTRIKCWWLGHNWPPFEDAECERCGQVWTNGDASGASVRLWFWWHYRRPQWLKPWTLLKRCHDCGKRFGKHTKDCPPF